MTSMNLGDGCLASLVPFEFNEQDGQRAVWSWQEDKVGKAFACREFAHYGVVFSGRIEGQGDSIGKSIFIVVLQMTHLLMGCFNAPGDRFGFQIEYGMKQFAGVLNGCEHNGPAAVTRIAVTNSSASSVFGMLTVPLWLS